MVVNTTAGRMIPNITATTNTGGRALTVRVSAALGQPLIFAVIDVGAGSATDSRRRDARLLVAPPWPRA